MNVMRNLLTLLVFFCSSLAAALPEIAFISPSYGSVAGGDVITITGSGFNGSTAVYVGSRPASSFTVISSKLISAISPVGVAGAVDIRVEKNANLSPITPEDRYVYTDTTWIGIVSGVDQDAVSLFNTSTNTTRAAIPLPADSLASIITPDGSTIYAIDSENSLVYVIDAATNTVINTIATSAGTGAFDLIVSPDGTRLYISNNLSGYVTVIDTVANVEITNILTAPNLGPLSITPDGKIVFVSSFAWGNVSLIDTTTNNIITTIPTGAVPGMISITPNGQTAYVSNSGSDTISIIDIATRTVSGSIGFPSGAGPYGSSIIPNGKKMYVINIYNATVSIVDIATNSITGTIALAPGSLPFWAASTPDGKTVYVIYEGTNQITAIDIAANTIQSTFTTSPGALQDIVMSPDPSPVAAFVAHIHTACKPSFFDASISHSPIGSIKKYVWNFGDGHKVITTCPTIEHVYTQPGPVNVRLRVINSAGTSTSKIFSSRFMSNNGSSLAKAKRIFTILSPCSHGRR